MLGKTLNLDTFNIFMTLLTSGSLFDNVDSVLSSDISQVLDSINNSSSLLPDTRLDLHTIYTQHGDMLSVYQVTNFTLDDFLTNVVAQDDICSLL